MTPRKCRHRVLVVDDDAAIRDSLAAVLVDEGYVVDTARDGREGLTKLRASPAEVPCVILLDLMMPVMSGQEFYEEQQGDATLASIPVVIISADADLPRKAATFGGKFLAKPVQLDAVIDAVERQCIKPS